MRLRDIVGLILALILAICIAFLTRVFLTREAKSPQEMAVKPQQTMKVLVAGKNLVTGDTVKPGDLVWQAWPKDHLRASYLTEETTKIDAFVHAIVRSPIHEGNPIVKDELVMRGDRGILAAILTPGKRAVSIDITAATSDSGLIFPGDYVDVILSTLVSVQNLQEGKSKTILRNVKVLAIDTSLAAPEEKPKVVPHEATLEVTPAQAEVLMAAVKEGTVGLSLHSMEKAGAESTPDSTPENKPGEKKIILMRGKEKSEVQFQGK